MRSRRFPVQVQRWAPAGQTTEAGLGKISGYPAEEQRAADIRGALDNKEK